MIESLCEKKVLTFQKLPSEQISNHTRHQITPFHKSASWLIYFIINRYVASELYALPYIIHLQNIHIITMYIQLMNMSFK